MQSQFLPRFEIGKKLEHLFEIEEELRRRERYAQEIKEQSTN